MTKQGLCFILKSMRTVSEETTFVGVSELRTKFAQLMKRAKHSHVIIERHHKPLAVLLDPQDYQQMDKMLERFSDILLALEAKQRELAARDKDYVPLSQARQHFLK